MHVFALFLVLNLPAERLQQKQNKGFVPTPQGSHTVTPSQTDDELDELPDVESINPKRPRRRPSRTKEIKGKYKSLWKLKFCFCPLGQCTQVDQFCPMIIFL